MPLLIVLATFAGQTVPPGDYRCVGAGAAKVLSLRPDHGYTWGDDPAVGTWRFDRREGVFLIATGPLALRAPRDGRYARGGIDLTLDEGTRLTCRMTMPPER